jgi:hypothetical protein
MALFAFKEAIFAIMKAIFAFKEAIFAFRKTIFAFMETIFAFLDAIVALLDRPIGFTQPKKIGPTTTLRESHRRRKINFLLRKIKCSNLVGLLAALLVQLNQLLLTWTGLDSQMKASKKIKSGLCGVFLIRIRREPNRANLSVSLKFGERSGSWFSY